MSGESRIPCSRASSWDVCIFLLLILRANFRRQSGSFELPVMVPRKFSNKREVDDSDVAKEGSDERMLVGLDGRGEKVPWLHCPS